MKLAVCWLMVGGSALALEFAPPKNYPKMGIMMAQLLYAQPEPLPMPKARTFLGVGSDFTREDRFDPYELWYQQECCGRWRDGVGNRLIVARITHKLPPLTQETVSREHFGARMADGANQIEPRQREQIDQWVADFVDMAVELPVRRKINKFALEEVWRYVGEEPQTLIYTFRPRRVGNRTASDWYCVVLKLNEGMELREAVARFESGFIAKLGLPPRSATDDGVQASELKVLKRGEKSAAQPEHPARQAVRKSIENYEQWWYADTDGYTIVSDLQDSVGKAIVEELKEQLPLLLKEFKKLTPMIVDVNDIGMVRIFQRREDYVRYVGVEQEWSGGAWMPAQRELVLFQHQNREEIMRVIRHEAFHQYLSNATAMLGAAPWFNEGHACFFEGARVDVKRGEVRLPEDQERAQILLENLDTATLLLPLLIQMDYAEFYDGSDYLRKLKYAMAWGVVYYLQKGVPSERSAPWGKLIAEYAKWLAVTRDQQQATLLAFKGIEMEKFQAAFADFWQHGRVK